MKKTPDNKSDLKLAVQSSEIDLVLKDLKAVDPNAAPEKLKPITFWVPESEHAAYEDLQIKTKRKFGKAVKKLFSLSIEKAKLAV